MGMHDLDERRRQAADLVCEGYDFGYQVADGQGWEHGGDDEWVKVLFFENDDEPDADSLKGHLAVRFAAGSDEVLETWAVVAGQPAGNPGVSLQGPGR